ncbi:hypothetical protein ACNOYE_37945 [Nannocystaceae bacterium ST9]
MAGEPGLAFVPEGCPIVCASTGAATLPSEVMAIAWTTSLDVEVPQESWAHVAALADGRVLVVVSGDPKGLLAEAGQSKMIVLSPAGQVSTVSKLGFGLVFDVAVGHAGELYLLASKGATQDLVVVNEIGEVAAIAPLGVHDHDRYPVMVATDEGVAAVYNSIDDPLVGTLSRMSPELEPIGTHEVPLTWEIDVTPEGALVLANLTSASWYDPEGQPLGQQGLADAWTLLGLVVLDEDRVVTAGGTLDDEQAQLSPRGMLVGVERSAGPTWSALHDRADTWCAAAQGVSEIESRTDEMYVALERFADGRLLAGGFETIGYPFANTIHDELQPLVELIDVGEEGIEVLARDRGLWQGKVESLAVADQSAYALFSEQTPSGTRLHVRKYAISGE